MKPNYILNPSSISFCFNNKLYRVEKSDSRYSSVIKAFNLSEDQMEQTLLDILDNTKKLDDAEKKGFVITNKEVTFRGMVLAKQNAQIVRRIYEEGLPLDFYIPFADNLEMIDDKEVHEHLWNFMSYKSLPITSDGYILAWKGVNDDYYSVMGNPETIVTSGEVDAKGHILNTVGAKIGAKRNRMSTDRSVYCDRFSLHCGSLDYATGWGSRVVIVKVHPKDIVCVPDDCYYQKMRVCYYEVVADYQEEITAPVVDQDNQPIESSAHIERKENTAERTAFIDRISSYLFVKSQEVDYLPIRSIQGIFSPQWPSKEQVKDALQVLEYTWNDSDIVIF